MVRSFLLAAGFLTRVPLRPGASDDAALSRALAFFPVVGLALGALLATAAWLLADHLAAGVCGVMLVAVLAVLTGGLHLDGLADVFDAWGSSKDRERMLAVMRDSRIGAYGASAVALASIAKVVAVAEVLARNDLAAVVAFPVVSRALAVVLILAFPYAREEGLGRAFRSTGDDKTPVVAVIVALVLAGWFAGFWPVVASGVVALWLASRMRARLGGLTGDVYGAAIELSEIAFLLVAGAR